MFQPPAAIGLFAVAMLLAVGCGQTQPPAASCSPVATHETALPKTLPKDAPTAVSNSYLEAALRDLLGRKTPLVRLAGPLMCPGHFDMRPSQLRELAGCGRLVRFDFQASLDKHFGHFGETSGGSRPVVTVHVTGGLCVPGSYLSACRQIADSFVADKTLDRREADRRLAVVERRMASLETDVLRRIDAAGLRGVPVLCSAHQADFCRWLRLCVAAEMWSAGAAATGEIKQAVDAAAAAGVHLIVANQPEGRRSADALADPLHARVVVFANFPSVDEDEAFDAMVRQNLAALLAVAMRAPRAACLPVPDSLADKPPVALDAGNKK